MKNKNLLIRMILIAIFSIMPLLALLQSISSHKWGRLLGALSIILCNFIPLITNKIMRRHGLVLSMWFDLACLPFLYSSLYLGPILKFYEKFEWWDMMLHTAAGVIFAALWLYIIILLNSKEVIITNYSPLFEVLSAFSFSLAVSALWELYEYVSDVLFKTNLMYFDIVDTMSDLLLCTAGSIMTVLIFYFRRKKQRIG